MLCIDPHLAERAMETSVHRMVHEAEVDRLLKQARWAPLAGLAEIGRRSLQGSGRALSALGAWLEKQGVAGVQFFDWQPTPSL